MNTRRWEGRSEGEENKERRKGEGGRVTEWDKGSYQGHSQILLYILCQTYTFSKQEREGEGKEREEGAGWQERRKGEITGKGMKGRRG